MVVTMERFGKPCLRPVKISHTAAYSAKLRESDAMECAVTGAVNRPPLPPFDAATAAQKVRMAEDAWNTRDPARVALAYTTDSRWRNRAEFIEGRDAIQAFLVRKWARELDYRLIKELWATICRSQKPIASIGGCWVPVPTNSFR